MAAELKFKDTQPSRAYLCSAGSFSPSLSPAIATYLACFRSMMAESQTQTNGVSNIILEATSVSPPKGSVPSQSLPLTFFDLPWFPCPPMQSLFFYHFANYPTTTLHFKQFLLPRLMHSLSLTLQKFFPLAAVLLLPPPPSKPYIRYTDGDSVSFSVVESAADFNRLKSDRARDAKLLHPFLPQLPPASVSADGTRAMPIMSLRISVFPGSGFCVGFAHCHVAADGIAFLHFVRSWASLCKSQSRLGGATCLEIMGKSELPPSHGRVEIKDSHGCEPIFFREVHNWASSVMGVNRRPTQQNDSPNRVRATFVLTKARIQRLKALTITNEKQSPPRVSTFAVTWAFMWVCLTLTETQAGTTKREPNHVLQKKKKVDDDDDDDYVSNFLFAVDCRNRVLEFTVPTTYFGNCLAPGIARLRKSELLGGNGLVLAAEAIRSEVEEVGKDVMEGAEKWMWELEQVISSGHVLSISGSPKMRAYDADFGWGRPLKVEYIHVDAGGAVALCESRDEDGAVELTLALHRHQMQVFAAIFEGHLNGTSN